MAEQDIYVGDSAVFTAIGENEGVIERIQARRSLLVRPPVANIEQVVIVCSLREPPLPLHFLDRLLVLAESRRLLAAICVNKIDLPGETACSSLIYTKRRATALLRPVPGPVTALVIYTGNCAIKFLFCRTVGNGKIFTDKLSSERCKTKTGVFRPRK